MPMGMLTNRKTLACLSVLVSLAACQARTPSPTLSPAPPIQQTAPTAPAVVASPSPMSSAAQTPSAAASAAAVANATTTVVATATPGALATTVATPEPSAAPGLQLCSPLQGVDWAVLPEMISNPFHPPRAGSDDPHQAVDFADIGADGLPLQGLALTGRGVQAVLHGRVAAVVASRFPYGNALLVETPLELLPGAWLEALSLPTPAPTLAAIPALTCPSAEPLEYDPEKRSLYLLYAHLEAPPAFEPGQEVGCGDLIGSVGMSGNALNPHLHLEARVGPAGIRLGSMAHYDTSATPQEMANYCQWRVSGLFQLVDPMLLWGVGEAEE